VSESGLDGVITVNVKDRHRADVMIRAQKRFTIREVAAPDRHELLQRILQSSIASLLHNG